MDGTTLCPHCKTRFKVAVAQLKAHQGLVRCGHCLQAFDARSDFIPDTPHPQLELTILNNKVEEPLVVAPDEVALKDSQVAPEELLAIAAVDTANEATEAPAEVEVIATPDALPQTEVIAPPVIQRAPVAIAKQIDHDDLDFTSYVPAYDDHANAGELYGGAADKPEKKRLVWLGWTLSFFMLLLLLGQAVYFLRADIAARFPDMKPDLVSACKSLGCTVNLPQKNDFMSIESSSLEADPNNAALITLTALLRNHATYPLAFPNLELTLNDHQDKPVARRIFKPAEYLPPVENEQTGLQGNHEINLKLSLDTTDLNPVGYRLLVFYPHSH
ncbi:MAG: DUF3426 domain-containing protein [Gallionella sp.]